MKLIKHLFRRTIKVNENKATTPVIKKMIKKHFFDELSLESGALDAAGTDALGISDRLEGHIKELRDMKAEKEINIPVNVIEKVASMVDQVKDLQQKIDEANNNICRLKYQFMGKTKQIEDSNEKSTKKKLARITPKRSKKRKIGNEIG
jgi:TolA-binding protein